MRRVLGVAVVASAVTASGLTALGNTASAATPDHRARGNPLNSKIVRFAPGTSKASMESAVKAAGGHVVTDLSRQNRMAVMPTGAGFDAAVAKQAGVATVWTEKAISIGYPDRAEGGKAGPPGSGPKGRTIADPWHDLDSFLDQNAPGVLQWDDEVIRARAAWNETTGRRTVRVAVLDSGVDGSHRELQANYDRSRSGNTVPCQELIAAGVENAQIDCGLGDADGHGTWVASRIAGSLNGFASNGVAPNVTIMGYQVLSTALGYGLTSWIVDGMYQACDNDADLINMSLGGYDLLGTDDEDYLMWVDAVNYCRAKGTAIIASAGNEHVRINKVDLTIGGRALRGVGQVSAGNDGYMSIVPGDTLENNDLRGLLQTPAGVPGVIMVSSTSNANGDPGRGTLAHLASTPTIGAREQLAYYSNYGSRIDLGAPGGARKYGVPRYDGGDGDVLYGGWGELGALTAGGEICTTPSLASLLTFACFTVEGQAFGWLQGTSMSAPNATGVAALALSAKSSLKGRPDALLSRLQRTARRGMVNETGPNSADTGPSKAGVACTSGYCHVKFYPRGRGNPITGSDAYGAGMVNAAEAVD
ncbi:MAG: S8 family serine peptidase [Kineosporiaceae bacterium]